MFEKHPGKIKVLHVDDDRIFLRLVQKKFGEYFNLKSVVTGAEAIEILKTETYDVILLDYILPDMNGTELIKKLKKDFPDMIVIFLTGKGSEEIAREAFLAGATDYFSKMIDDFAFREILLNSVRKAIENKATEKALKESREKHKYIFELSPEAIVILDKNGNVIDVNGRLYDWLGYLPREVIGKNLLEIPFFPPESKEKATKSFIRRMKGETVLPYDMIFLNKEGEELTGRITATPIKDNNGRFFQNLVMISNITKQKRAEKKLEESEKKFRRIAELSKDIIFQLDRNGLITYLSPSVTRILGYIPDEVIGRNIFDYVFQEHVLMSKEILVSMLSGEHSGIFEVSVLDRNGTPVPFEVNAVGIEKDREVIGVQGMARDITFRKKAEIELLRERDKAQTYLDIAGSIILALNTSGVVTLINRKGCAVLGYSENEVIGKNWFYNFIPGKIRKEALGFFKKMIQGEQDGKEYMENPIVVKSGEERIIGWYNAVLRDEEGNITGILSSGVDVTEMRMTEEALRNTRDELEKRVHERTVELLKKNEILRNEVIARKKAEKDIRDAYEKLREFQSIVNRSPAVVFLWKVAPGWPVEFLSENISQFGYSAEDLTSGRVSWPGITHPDDLPWLEAEVGKYLKNKTREFEQKYRLITKSGEIRWVEDRTRAIMDENGVITHYQGIILDVTEKKKAESASRRSMELLHLVMDNIPEFVFWKDRNSVFLGCNKSFARVAGLDNPEEIVGKTDYDLPWTKEESDFYRECDQRVMATGIPEYNIYERQLQADGNIAWLETNKLPLKDENGQVIGILGTYEDITERKKKDRELREYREHLEEIVAERTAELQEINRQLQSEITERKKAEEALRESEEKFKNIFENSPISIWQEDFSVVKRYLDKLQEKGIADLDCYFKENPHELIKCAKMVKINDVNKATLELFEAENKADLFSGLVGILNEESYESLKKEFIAIAQKDTSFETETINMTLKGKKKYISLKWSVVPGFEETYGNVLFTIFDITERKAVERALKERLKLEKMVSGISSRFISSVDFDAVLEYSLEQMGRLGNADRSYTFLFQKNQDLMDNTHEWCAGGVESQKDKLQNLPLDMFPWWMKKLRNGEIIHISDVSDMPEEAESERKLLESQNIRSLLVFPMIIKGELAGFIGFDDTRNVGKRLEDDITLLRISTEIIGNAIERRMDSESLKKAMVELERSNRDLEQFAYIASHDLQEPLRMITSYMALLEKRYGDKLDSNAREFISYSVDGAKRMRGLIRDLLVYSKVSKKIESFHEVDCSLVLSQALQNLKIAIEENQAVIIKGELPTIKGDSSQLIQLFQNLISNALKFRGNNKPVISVSCEEKEKEYKFSFKDNGIGIEPEFFKDIFLPFRRLHTREEYPGSGIGLAVCKKIVERHGGMIWAESEPNMGSTFFFTIHKF